MAILHFRSSSPNLEDIYIYIYIYECSIRLRGYEVMHEICLDWKTLFILTGLHEIFTFILNTLIMKYKAMDAWQSDFVC